jgi:EpsI family protein
VAIGAVLTAGGALASDTLRSQHPLPPETVTLENVAMSVDRYEGIPIEVDERVQKQLGSDALLMREYARPEEPPVWLCVDYHRAQRLGAQIHSPRNCYPGAGWSLKHFETVTLDIPGAEHAACWLTLENGDGVQRMALYWFETRWGHSSQEIDLKLDLLRSAFVRRPTDAVLVRLSADVIQGDFDECRARIERFAAAIAPHLTRELPFSRVGA